MLLYSMMLFVFLYIQSDTYIIICINMPQFIHSSGGYMSYFQFVKIVNRAIRNTFVYAFLWTCTQISIENCN